MRPPIVILCGGKGTRLHPITNDEIPKPMVDVCGKPFLYWLIQHYVKIGFKEFILSTGHLAHVIEGYDWPKEWDISYIRDLAFCKGWDRLSSWPDMPNVAWIVNGDTYLPHWLPEWDQPGVIQFEGVDAGAQLYYRYGPQKVLIASRPFYDIGTPEGLEAIKKYFMTHLANK
jgi:hypothetical protein